MADQMIYQPPEIQDISRQQKMAQMLLQQQPTPAGQMVGNVYVPTSPLQHLAGLANQAVGLYGMQKAEDLAKALRGKQQQTVEL